MPKSEKMHCSFRIDTVIELSEVHKVHNALGQDITVWTSIGIALLYERSYADAIVLETATVALNLLFVVGERFI